MEGWFNTWQGFGGQAVTRWLGSVAYFTSVRPFPQAEDETNHKKAKIPVTIRSLKQMEECLTRITVQLIYFKHVCQTLCDKQTEVVCWNISQMALFCQHLLELFFWSVWHTYNDRATVRFSIELLIAHIHDKSESTVQEAEDSHTDEELSRGREISLQVRLVCAIMAIRDVIWWTLQPSKYKSCLQWTFQQTNKLNPLFTSLYLIVFWLLNVPINCLCIEGKK